MKNCPKCKGQGTAISGRECPACQGEGTVTEQRYIELSEILKNVHKANQSRTSNWTLV